MSSLREQLLKAGLATRKDVRRVEQELKKQRRQKQARRLSKKERAAREAAEKARRREELLRRKREERARRLAAEQAEARQHQADQIARRWALDYREGPVPFWHRQVEGPVLHRLLLPESLAISLRAGELAVVAARGIPDWDYFVVPAEVARRIRAILPERVVHWTPEPWDGDPAEGLYGDEG